MLETILDAHTDKNKMTISHIIRFTALAYLLHCLPANANYHTTYSLTETITDNNQTTTQNKTYSYNNRDQLQQVQDAIGGALITYQYDANGNQISKTDASGTTNLVYGPRDRLLTITLPGAPPIAYSYNEAGLRDSQSQNGQTLHYIYDQTSLIAETNTNGNELAHHHPLQRGPEWIAGDRILTLPLAGTFERALCWRDTAQQPLSSRGRAGPRITLWAAHESSVRIARSPGRCA